MPDPCGQGAIQSRVECSACNYQNETGDPVWWLQIPVASNSVQQCLDFYFTEEKLLRCPHCGIAAESARLLSMQRHPKAPYVTFWHKTKDATDRFQALLLQLQRFSFDKDTFASQASVPAAFVNFCNLDFFLTGPLWIDSNDRVRHAAQGHVEQASRQSAVMSSVICRDSISGLRIYSKRLVFLECGPQDK